MEATPAGLRPIPLYFPYIFVRRADWLRACALYWPRLAILRPEGFLPGDYREGPVGRALRDELGFFVDVDPAPHVPGASAELLSLINGHEDALRARYGGPFDGNSFVMDSQMSGDLRTALLESGLAGDPGDVAGPSWLDLHPRVTSAYTSLLMHRVADANELSLVTDQVAAHAAVTNAADLVLDLLDDGHPAVRTTGDVASAYSVTAIETVVPADLAQVPVDKIIKARRELAVQFDAFRAHLGTLSREFTEIAAIDNGEVMRARVEMLVHDQLDQAVKDLRRELRTLGLQPAQALLSLKTLTPPALVAAASGIAGLPSVIAGAGTAAAYFVGTAHAARREARVRKRSPAGYLLGSTGR
ncbi:DUF6236 family protein [Actinophytocola algeriensis]|uniref:Uncharacterized protein n=1 Tax=Actinophytocola algeriensis TaxID=1768010 RepID=A0A7W7Q557_9PSEU|nr:DUF6236 family protein [Actinophytocola algeriensis]MBB4907251.1 hypothetical protein [Actinophytocola algeriensis]MBE1478734.1 hypothetical protein [Actinophytocola algeriensis]